MKRAIVVNADYRFMSALVDKGTARELRVGDKVRAARALDLDYLGSLPAGETGEVIYADGDGIVEIKFDRPLEQLYDWRNCLLLVPFDTPKWIEGFELVTAWEAKELERV